MSASPQSDSLTQSGATEEQNNADIEDKQQEDIRTYTLPETDEFSDAPFISLDDIRLLKDDFIRYMKEDGIIYQGYVLPGEPVEEGFNHYPGQEDDIVVQHKKPDEGYHVARHSDQIASNREVMVAKENGSFGRDVEVVKTDEIVAVSPNGDHGWYRIEDAWTGNGERPKYPEELTA